MLINNISKPRISKYNERTIYCAEYIDPEKFGTGIINGIIASETTNNAGIAGDFVPLLTLGIPGDTVTDKWKLRGQVLLTLN